VVKINHGAGFVSLYAHQSKILVHLGQHVTRGQVIGKVGSTGRSTGPHLHFGLYKRGKPVDPLHYIARKGTGKIKTIVEKHTVMKNYPIARHKQVILPGAMEAKKRLSTLIQHPTKHPYQWYHFKKNMVQVEEIAPKSGSGEGGDHG
jgi:hypothetical protein